jgi:hypothetical protein
MDPPLPWALHARRTLRSPWCRWSQHTSQCATCLKALKRVQQLRGASSALCKAAAALALLTAAVGVVAATYGLGGAAAAAVGTAEGAGPVAQLLGRFSACLLAAGQLVTGCAPGAPAAVRGQPSRGCMLASAVRAALSPCPACVLSCLLCHATGRRLLQVAGPQFCGGQGDSQLAQPSSFVGAA